MDVFAWSYEHRMSRGYKWYTVAAAFAITLVVISFLLGYYLFGAVIILFVGVYLLFEINSHPIVNIVISEEGVSIDDDLFTFAQILSFSIIQIKNIPPLLRIQTKSKMIGTLDVYITSEINLEDLRLFLINYVQENTNARLTVIDQILMGLRL